MRLMHTSGGQSRGAKFHACPYAYVYIHLSSVTCRCFCDTGDVVFAGYLTVSKGI